MSPRCELGWHAWSGPVWSLVRTCRRCGKVKREQAADVPFIPFWWR